MKKQSTFRYLAAACFFILACLDAIDLFQEIYVYGYYFRLCISEIIQVVLTLALAISLFLGNWTVLAISLGCLSASALYNLIDVFIRLIRYHNISLLVSTMYSAFWLASYLLLSIAYLRPQKSKKLGISAAGVLFVKMLFNLLTIYGATIIIFQPHWLNMHNSVYHLAGIAGAVLVGFSLSEKRESKQKAKQAVPASAQPQITNSYETLTRLKALVDSGAITQEEFDAKKKQLLGL